METGDLPKRVDSRRRDRKRSWGNDVALILCRKRRTTENLSIVLRSRLLFLTLFLVKNGIQLKMKAWKNKRVFLWWHASFDIVSFNSFLSAKFYVISLFSKNNCYPFFLFNFIPCFTGDKAGGLGASSNGRSSFGDGSRDGRDRRSGTGSGSDSFGEADRRPGYTPSYEEETDR